jgi:hypothetical protein
MLAAALCALVTLQDAPKIGADNFDQWREHLKPSAQELGFEEAQYADKPILLWAMNGHPLACT